MHDYKELTVAGINEGKLMLDLETVVRKMGRETILSHRDHGDPKIAVAKVTLTLTLSKNPEYENFYTIQPEIQFTPPKLPPCQPSLVASDGQNLVMQSVGTSMSNPNQTNLIGDLTEEEQEMLIRNRENKN